MPNIKPLSKLVTKARTIRDDHRARHAPSGFAFALADSIDYLDQNHWAKATSHNSMFFSPRYLRVLEDAGPENLRPCYALIFNEKEPVAAIAAQTVAVSMARSAIPGCDGSSIVTFCNSLRRPGNRQVAG